MRDFIKAGASLNNEYLLIRDISDPDRQSACCREFNAIAETAMVDIDQICSSQNRDLQNGLGLFTFALEQCCTVLRKMTNEHATGTNGEGDFGYGVVLPIVKQLLSYRSGFGSAVHAQIERNYNYAVQQGNPIENSDWWTDFEEANETVADILSRLGVYNSSQNTIRDAAVFLSRLNFEKFFDCLLELSANLKSLDDWTIYASRVRIDASGKPAYL